MRKFPALIVEKPLFTSFSQTQMVAHAVRICFRDYPELKGFARRHLLLDAPVNSVRCWVMKLSTMKPHNMRLAGGKQ